MMSTYPAPPTSHPFILGELAERVSRQVIATPEQHKHELDALLRQHEAVRVLLLEEVGTCRYCVRPLESHAGTVNNCLLQATCFQPAYICYSRYAFHYKDVLREDVRAVPIMAYSLERALEDMKRMPVVITYYPKRSR